jgi:Icc-related predicted phosphoesterase
MIIDCISDLHGFYPELQGGDLLIIAGDLVWHSQMKDYDEFFLWCAFQEYKKIIFISGNHDNLAMSQFDWGENIEYLLDSGTEFEGLKIWGSPWTRSFRNMNPKCKAFTKETDKELSKFWGEIPGDIDILITHSPPAGILDKIVAFENQTADVGSPSLRHMVLDRNRFPKLKLHVFGHIHEWGGQIFETNFTKFVNASIVNEFCDHTNKSGRVIL